MAYDPDKYARRSIRLAGYDYTQAGAYFVTICTAGREHRLSTIVEGQVSLSQIGLVVERCWQALPRYFTGLALDEYVLMPDHLHAIVVLPGGGVGQQRPAGLPRGTVPASLPAVIQNFKSVATRRANTVLRTPGVALWQRNYYEHIIRSDDDLSRIRRYIAENPARWRTLDNA